MNNFWHCIAVRTLRIWKSASVETIQHTSTGTGMNKIVRNMNIKPLLAIPECWALISQIPLPYPAYFLHYHSNQGIYQENPCWRSPRGKGQCPVGQGKNGMALSGLALSECIKSVNIVKHKLLFTSPHPLLQPNTSNTSNPTHLYQNGAKSLLIEKTTLFQIDIWFSVLQRGELPMSPPGNIPPFEF